MQPTWRQYQSYLRQLGCIVCRHMGRDSAADIHHIRTNTGVGRKADEFDVIPLCPRHHRNGNLGEAIHAGQKTWEALYGDELSLVAEVRAMADKYFSQISEASCLSPDSPELLDDIQQSFPS